jgi:hypothetical protein
MTRMFNGTQRYIRQMEKTKCGEKIPDQAIFGNNIPVVLPLAVSKKIYFPYLLPAFPE